VSRIRSGTDADLEQVLTLNQASVPEVGPLDAGRLRRLVEQAAAFRVAEVDGTVAGFIVALHEGADYDSPNYRWFAARHDRFLYVDRVAVAAGRRGLGLGRRFYEELLAGTDRPVLCAEVNVRPRNDASLAFHARLGFTVRAEVPDPRYRDLVVAMLERPVPPDGGPARHNVTPPA
jgi:uncharacterized protein